MQNRRDRQKKSWKDNTKEETLQCKKEEIEEEELERQ